MNILRIKSEMNTELQVLARIEFGWHSAAVAFLLPGQLIWTNSSSAHKHENLKKYCLLLWERFSFFFGSEPNNCFAVPTLCTSALFLNPDGFFQNTTQAFVLRRKKHPNIFVCVYCCERKDIFLSQIFS